MKKNQIPLKPRTRSNTPSPTPTAEPMSTSESTVETRKLNPISEIDEETLLSDENGESASTPTQNVDQIIATLASLDPDLKQILIAKLSGKDKISGQIENLVSSVVSADAAYVTPNLHIRKYRDHERLQGRRNFKVWVPMIELDLQAMNLLNFIKTEKASHIELSDNKRATLDAQTVQILKASVNKEVLVHINKAGSAFEIFNILKTLFEQARSSDYVSLHKQFYALRFREGYSPLQFTAKFENLLAEYKDLGTTFSKEYVATIFLEKIDGILNPNSKYFGFYSSLCALPVQNQTYEYVKQRFLELETSQPSQITNQFRKLLCFEIYKIFLIFSLFFQNNESNKMYELKFPLPQIFSKIFLSLYYFGKNTILNSFTGLKRYFTDVIYVILYSVPISI